MWGLYPRSLRKHLVSPVYHIYLVTTGRYLKKTDKLELIHDDNSSYQELIHG